EARRRRRRAPREVPRTGIEPVTPAFSVLCSTNCATSARPPAVCRTLMITDRQTVGLVLSIRLWYFCTCTLDRPLVLSHSRMARHATMGNVNDTEKRPLPRRQPRRFWGHAVLFVASVLLVHALIGDRGLMQNIRARRAHAAAAGDLLRLKQENARLREQARRLRNDPRATESVARGELGLLRPGEILVTVKDVK